jgi:energy-coupling factor transporter ATP-binding protein EcfA2
MTPHAGQVALDGKPLPHRSRLAGRLGYLPQNADMLLFEESVRREVGFTLRRLATPTAKREALLEEMLRFCGLQRMASRAPLSLSHGERHMLAVASVLAARPSIILLDEPLTGLDARIGTALLHLLTYCARQHEMAVLLVTHGKLPATWGDRCLVLEGGRLRDAA